MAEKYVSIEDLKFLLFEVHQIESLFSHDFFKEYNRETVDMMIDSAKDFADKMLFPYFEEMDRQGVQLEDGKVKVHPQVYKILNELGASGWINATKTYEEGGMQLPYMVHNVAGYIYSAANNSGIGYTMLTGGAARLIASFGSDELKETYASKMYAGAWQGTMALTEPQAGSSLSDITTVAIPQANGTYKIQGQKIFISGGDYEDAENVVHLLLARIEGAPQGTKGISLFVVPKHRVNDDGSFTYNDVTTSGLFHKMGQNGYVTTHLMMGEKEDCHGYLLGQANKGLSYMFQMMNSARIEVGMMGTSIASAAYQAALEYANERPQGRNPSSKDPNETPRKIIEHADVRRMLFLQKAIVEGSLSLILECSKYNDLAKVSEGEDKEKCALMLDFLTPIVKTYPTEMGLVSVNNAMQCLGGYGYCVDFPIEQLLRDIRITTIYEGTTGIQSMDLLGRKATMRDGLAMKILLKEILSVIEVARGSDVLNAYADQLDHVVKEYQKVFGKLLQTAGIGKIEAFLADANLFMEFSGILVMGWQWLKQGLVAEEAMKETNTVFYRSKITTLKYYFEYEVPKFQGLATRLMSDDMLTLAQEEDHLI